MNVMCIHAHNIHMHSCTVKWVHTCECVREFLRVHACMHVSTYCLCMCTCSFHVCVHACCASKRACIMSGCKNECGAHRSTSLRCASSPSATSPQAKVARGGRGRTPRAATPRHLSQGCAGLLNSARVSLGYAGKRFTRRPDHSATASL